MYKFKNVVFMDRLGFLYVYDQFWEELFFDETTYITLEYFEINKLVQDGFISQIGDL
jgi:hypothetical protein